MKWEAQNEFFSANPSENTLKGSWNEKKQFHLGFVEYRLYSVNDIHSRSKRGITSSDILDIEMKKKQNVTKTHRSPHLQYGLQVSTSIQRQIRGSRFISSEIAG